MNQEILDELERLREQYDEFGDVSREKAYSRAVESVRAHRRQIMSGKDAMQLKWIGKGIGWRIDQILGTDTVEENTEEDNESKSKKLRPIECKNKKTKTKTIGNEPPLVPKYKAKFVDAPPSSNRSRENTNTIRARFTHEDIEGGVATPVNASANAGVTIQRPDSPNGLPRETATQLLGIIRKLVLQMNRDAHVSLVDTYRRGYNKIPVLVFLLTDRIHSTSTESTKQIVSYIVDQLQRSGILFGIIKNKDANIVQGHARFNSGQIVPLYLICVRARDWPCALLRYTGPRDVWTQLGDVAVTRGLRLTDHGLYQGSNAIKIQNEKHVFKILNVEYIDPEQRG